MEISANYCLVVFAIFFASFFIKSIVGFGDPLLSGPLLSMFLENRLISPANLLISVVINGYMAWINRKYFSIKNSASIVLFILIGVVPGTLLLKFATSWILKVILGLLVVMIGIEMLVRKKDVAAQNNPMAKVLACFFSGVTSGLYGINLFFISYIERTSSNRNEFRGKLCFVFLTENICRIIAYFACGIMTKDIFLLALFAAPGVIAGLYIGSRIDNRMREETVRWITITIFIIGGVSIVIKTIPWPLIF